MIQAVKQCFKKFFKFSGRSSKSEYWYFVFFLTLIEILFLVIDHSNRSIKFENYSPVEITQTIVYLIILIPLAAAFWRRMHDTGHSGLQYLSSLLVYPTGYLSFAFLNNAKIEHTVALSIIAFAALAIAISYWIYIFTLLIQPSDPGPNKYGDPPT